MNRKIKSIVQIASLILALALVAGGANRPDAKDVKISQAKTAAKASPGEAYSKLPLSFEANQGQVSAEAKFIARGHDGDAFLTSTGAVFALRGTPAVESSFRMELVASNASVIP